MASTYTQNTGIEKIGAGEQTGLWNTTTNLNFDIIDRASNGVGLITLSGTTHTLTTTDGSLSDGQYKVLVFGGSPSGTNTVTVAPNSQNKQYLVVNNSGQSVIISQGSGASVTIANGATDIVYCDGAGSGAAVIGLAAALSGLLKSADIGVAVQAYAAVLANTTASFLTAEKSKLTGIETGATADQTAAQIKTAYESNADTNEFSDAEQTKLSGIEASANVTDATNVAAAGALMDSEVANLAQVKAFDETDYATAAQGTKADDAAPTASPAFTGSITEEVFAVTGTTPTLDPVNGTIQTWTLSGASAPTDSFSTGQSITLMVDDGTTNTITWPTMTWINNGGAAPTLATTGYTVFVLWKVSTTLYGALVGDGSSWALVASG